MLSAWVLLPAAPSIIHERKHGDRSETGAQRHAGQGCAAREVTQRGIFVPWAGAFGWAPLVVSPRFALAEFWPESTSASAACRFWRPRVELPSAGTSPCSPSGAFWRLPPSLGSGIPKAASFL